jgi:hypothetical protein
MRALMTTAALSAALCGIPAVRAQAPYENAPEVAPIVPFVQADDAAAQPSDEMLSPSGSRLGDAPKVERNTARRLADDWRYRYHNGRHWYYLPSNAWVVWIDEEWIPYTTGMFRAKPITPQLNGQRYGSRGYNSGVYGQSITKSVNAGEFASPQPDPFWGPNIPASGYLSDTPTGYGHVVPGMNAPRARTPLPNQAELRRARSKAAGRRDGKLPEPSVAAP